MIVEFAQAMSDLAWRLHEQWQWNPNSWAQ